MTSKMLDFIEKIKQIKWFSVNIERQKISLLKIVLIWKERIGLSIVWTMELTLH